MANIPEANDTLPGVYTDVVTQSRGVSLPGGTRVAAMIGEGSTDSVLVVQAIGGGNDGLNPTYTSVSGRDGRHFQIPAAPLVSNRTTLFKNGIPLVGFEGPIDNLDFSSKYDYRVDITNGRIELQKAQIADLGGSYYNPLSTNVGDGYLSEIELQDVNAQPELWTIRCVSVQRNASNLPIAGTAKFLAFGSISGSKIDANGNPIVWVANGTEVSNGIISFAITENKILSTTISPFREGDGFTIRVSSGVLVSGDSLTANYIPTANLNDPFATAGLNDVVIRHGSPSLSNNLSLGAQLAYANQAPSLITVQAAPAMPRRVSYILEPSVDASSTNPDDFIFPLPIGVVPDLDSNIHFFVTNTTTNVETQLLPNKMDYYTLDTPGNPTTNQFIFSNLDAPAGYSFFYTVKESMAAVDTGFDGYIGRDQAFSDRGVFSSSITFDSSHIGKTLKIIESTNVGNEGVYTINDVRNGKLYVELDAFTDFTAQNPVSFELINKSSGLAIPAYSANDGVLVPILTTATGTFTSASVNFGAIPQVVYDYRLQINGSTDNNGLYDIVSAGTNTVTLRKVLVNEENMRFEVLDPNDVSYFIVVNHNVVPSGNQLRVSVVDQKDASFYDAGWINALESLEAFECDMVVPLPKQTISIIFQNTLAHCKAMSNIRNRKERVLLCGAIQGLTVENLIGTQDAAVENIGILEGIQGDNLTDILSGNIEDLANYSVADAFGNTYRCIYFYPDQIIVQAGADNILIDGFYQAAAAAGYLSYDLRVENPLTFKTFSGFTIPRSRQLSPLKLEQLANAGVCTLQPITGGGRVVWGITTSQSGVPEEREISIIFIRDKLAKFLRAGFAGFVGNPEQLETQSTMNTRAVILLNSLVSQKLITAYKDLIVSRDTVDPTQWNISVKCQPTYPINFIYIKVSVGQI